VTAGRDFVLGRGLWWELRHRNRDGQRIGDGLGPGVEAARMTWGRCGGRGGRRPRFFFLGGGFGGNCARARRNRDGFGLGPGVEAGPRGRGG
jgi:hypothetical protein